MPKSFKQQDGVLFTQIPFFLGGGGGMEGSVSGQDYVED